MLTKDRNFKEYQAIKDLIWRGGRLSFTQGDKEQFFAFLDEAVKLDLLFPSEIEASMYKYGFQSKEEAASVLSWSAAMLTEPNRAIRRNFIKLILELLEIMRNRAL